ncbi:MAG: beta-ketoacyl-ACP synthase II [Anaerolineae bacterium]|nr:beta-ketoacyl-ACP synthase II [Chloroflexota bacterium]MBP6298265.1 beta-ketoacyl-ACP synthase II [Anaerolineae bacterium]
MTRRVVITGCGVISPCGNTAAESWEAIKNGRSGISKITHFDTSTHNVQIAGEVKDFKPELFMSNKEVRRRDRYQHLATAAAREAMDASGLSVDDSNRHRIGVFVGSAVGGVTNFYREVMDLGLSGDLRQITPFAIPMLMGNGASAHISLDHGITGPSYVLTSACATGADNIGHAYNLIQLGRLDAALAGCGEAPIMAMGIAAFDRIGATSRENDNPAGAVRPFSKDRGGLAFAEGAGVIVLEELEAAKARQANILAELVGYGSTSDAYHITAPHPEGNGAARALRMALDDARLTPQDVDYINAHGTATSLNDAMETKAVKTVFGEHAYHVPMSSTKSMTGHGMGMTAAIEAAFSVFAIRDNVAPPTINYREPDPDCDLDYVPNVAREMPVNVVMSNSFGFGGHNVSLIFRRFTE